MVIPHFTTVHEILLFITQNLENKTKSYIKWVAVYFDWYSPSFRYIETHLANASIGCAMKYRECLAVF